MIDQVRTSLLALLSQESVSPSPRISVEVFLDIVTNGNRQGRYLVGRIVFILALHCGLGSPSNGDCRKLLRLAPFQPDTVGGNLVTRRGLGGIGQNLLGLFDTLFEQRHEGGVPAVHDGLDRLAVHDAIDAHFL